MLIAIEGADGCGKDSVADAVAKVMGAERLNFPNDDGVTGPMIREYLARRWAVWCEGDLGPCSPEPALSALAFQALQVANRMEVMGRIRRAEHMVLARYWQSGYVYGALDGLDPDWLLAVHECMEQADINILLDLDAEAALERQGDRGETLERYEGKIEFTRKVVDGYRDLWEADIMMSAPGWWRVVDASQPLDVVVASVLKIVFEDLLRKPVRYVENP